MDPYEENWVECRILSNVESSVVVSSTVFRDNEARRRLVWITLDCVLGLMACMGVELIILLRYAKDYDIQSFGFDDSLWRNDEWAARALNEVRMVVVVSWTDLASRTLFALGLVMTTTNVKQLLQRLLRTRNRVIQSTTVSHEKTTQKRYENNVCISSSKLPKLSEKSTPLPVQSGASLEQSDFYWEYD
ncbi:unnamed protein product [Phytophthora fragariaefolia]|uniref:Unnamed protein product n=1 Tax=Phytophthora fragariaefolia TaxID=1490495 RepID=A0A9W6XPW6_9STRA|nr:unnamed protein product [Phytophthora fragariaefolia]